MATAITTTTDARRPGTGVVVEFVVAVIAVAVLAGLVLGSLGQATQGQLAPGEPGYWADVTRVEATGVAQSAAPTTDYPWASSIEVAPVATTDYWAAVTRVESTGAGEPAVVAGDHPWSGSVETVPGRTDAALEAEIARLNGLAEAHGALPGVEAWGARYQAQADALAGG